MLIWAMKENSQENKTHIMKGICMQIQASLVLIFITK